MRCLKLEQDNKNNYEINVQCEEVGNNFECSSILEGTKKHESTEEYKIIK